MPDQPFHGLAVLRFADIRELIHRGVIEKLNVLLSVDVSAIAGQCAHNGYKRLRIEHQEPRLLRSSQGATMRPRSPQDCLLLR